MAIKKKPEVPDTEKNWLLEQLQQRFEKYPGRHPEIGWDAVLKQLQKQPQHLRTLYEMQYSGGEPDLVIFDEEPENWYFVDCAAETPADRRSLCYDDQALAARKQHKPRGSAVAMAEAMGAGLLTETQYRSLQRKGAFDLKTSSWILTPDAVRRLGGALFCDRRYDQVFVYHNGADSYYSSRGFRLALKL
ncbi:DUF4256 domain-containing protein [Niabella terrae]